MYLPGGYVLQLNKLPVNHSITFKLEVKLFTLNLQFQEFWRGKGGCKEFNNIHDVHIDDIVYHTAGNFGKILNWRFGKFFENHQNKFKLKVCMPVTIQLESYLYIIHFSRGGF